MGTLFSTSFECRVSIGLQVGKVLDENVDSIPRHGTLASPRIPLFDLAFIPGSTSHFYCVLFSTFSGHTFLRKLHAHDTLFTSFSFFTSAGYQELRWLLVATGWNGQKGRALGEYCFRYRV